VHTPRST